MFDVRKWRVVLFLAALVLLVGAVALLYSSEMKTCMGIRVLSEKDSGKYTQYEYQNLWDYLFFNGEKVAMDVESSTIYICQDIRQDTKKWQLEGELTISIENHRMFFAWDEAFEDMAAAVRQGHPFQLIISDGSETHMQYNVVFTTLPVMFLEGDFSHMNEEDREVGAGKMCLWAPVDPTTGRYSVKSSDMQWHFRGRSTVLQDKKSWKLSAKTPTGGNRDISLLGLGKDDDWILNAMTVDDTKHKEKLIMELWNGLTARDSRNYNMSSGEYVELVMNGEYCGLYLLQRRVDRKYLSLTDEDILLKGQPVWETATVEEAYEIISSPLSEEETYGLMENIWACKKGFTVDIDNFIDVSLFIQMGSLTDNTSIKNMFYLLHKTESGYDLYLIPWDTDLAFGTTWTDDFVHEYDLNLEIPLYRREYVAVNEAYPELKEKMSARWAELRAGTLTQENLESISCRLEEVLVQSGALDRDRQRWGQMYEGKDTFTTLRSYAQDRMTWLDEYYKK